MRSAVVIAISLLPLFSHCTPHSQSSANARMIHRRREVPSNPEPGVATVTPESRIAASSTLDPSSTTSEEYAIPTAQSNNFFVSSSFEEPEPVAALFAPQEQAAMSATTRPTPLMMGYYPDWVGSSFPPEKIDFRRYDWIDFAFALPNENFELVWDDPKGSPDLLRRLVRSAHASGKKVKLSVGGATGSKHFSAAVSTDGNRATFVNNIKSTMTEFAVDGVDLDWEYPGQTSGGTESFSPDDTVNFLAFLQLLRSTLSAGTRITAATQTATFVDEHGEPLKDVSEFAKVLDAITVMAYDTWGSSSDPGANAPLNNGCRNSTQPTENAVGAYQQWTAAGFPASQIALGVPSYGYISKSSATTLQARSRTRSPHFARNDDDNNRDPNNVVVSNDDGTDGGQIQFRALVAQGALVKGTSGDAQYVGGGGFQREWHPCSSTPWLHSDQAGQVITYDDPQSLTMKAQFARDVGLLGVCMWDVHGDTDDWALTDSLRKGLFGAR